MYSSTHSLTSALDGGEWSASRPGSFTPRERAPGTHWIGGWVGPRAVLDAVVERKIPSTRRESNPDRPARSPALYRLSYQKAKGKVVLNSAPQNEDVLGEWRYKLHVFLTSALDGGEWPASRPDRFIPRERAPATH
jgi:hypothetical protein